MNEEDRAKFHRSAQLEEMTSKQLGDVITAMGWTMGARQNKTNRKLAILHLEKHPVGELVVKSLKLRPLEPVG